MFKIELILCKIKTLYVFHNTKHHVHYSARVIEPKMIRGPGRIVIARGCTVNASGGLFLGGHVHLSENACIFSVGFDYDQYTADGTRRHRPQEVVFAGNAWVTAGVYIPPGTIVSADNTVVVNPKPVMLSS